MLVSVPSPTHDPLAADDPSCFPQVSLYLTDSHQFGMVRPPHLIIITIITALSDDQIGVLIINVT